jgi:hypothetical protein
MGSIFFSTNIGIMNNNNKEHHFINSTIVGLQINNALHAKYAAIILTRARGKKSLK